VGEFEAPGPAEVAVQDGGFAGRTEGGVREGGGG
jgi:hypothetical protein